MAEQAKQPPDPLTMWRDWAAQAEEQWNQYLNQVMGTEAFAATMGRSMETILALQTRLAQQFEATLKAWNLPTRTDIVALGERLAEIEERLDRLADGLGQSTVTSPRPAPVRSRAAARARDRAASESPPVA